LHQGFKGIPVLRGAIKINMNIKYHFIIRQYSFEKLWRESVYCQGGERIVIIF